MRFLRAFALFAVVLAVVLARPTTASTRPKDPTARGLDLFVHGPSAAPSGGSLSLSVEALGFPTITSSEPVAGATIEAAWDPESLHLADAPLPPSVVATTNDGGHATIAIPMPVGEPQSLTLLVSVKAGGKSRVRELTIARTGAERISLFTSESAVVPGGAVSAWALCERSDNGAPIAGAPVEVELLEGGVSRFSGRATTDPAGSAMFRVPIPRAVEPGLSWTLVARSLGPTAAATTSTTQTLTAREETPGKPVLTARFDEGSVKPGDDAHFRVRLRDASGEAVANQVVWVFWGAKGVSAPEDAEAFRRIATRMTTDGAGEIVGPVKTPTTIALKGTSMHLTARTELSGVELKETASVEVGRKRAYVEVLPESHEILPGVEQRVVLRLMGDDGEPIEGRFDVEGDGLKASIATDAHGEAEITWNVPKGIGAKRDVGPCAGGVAAALTLRTSAGAEASKITKSAFEGALVGRDGLPVCVAVDRDAQIFLRPERSVVRAGDAVKVQIAGENRRAFSLVATSATGADSVVRWVERGQDGITLELPATASGVYRLSVAGPRAGEPALQAATSILVLPRVVPKVEGRVVGGRAAPGGKVEVEAVIVDENGKGMPGSVAVAMIDKLGGGSLAGLLALDTRTDLCGDAGADPDRCDAFLLGDAKEDPARRAALAAPGTPLLEPILDPAKSQKADVDATFKAVVQSLEGAVWQSSDAPETLVDVRRKEGGRYVFNPELMTLVTDAMDKPPELPGGEAVTLADLLSVDPQVTYDNVGRRLTRLKLFDLLKALRDYRTQNGIDLSEPVFKEPNALLRRLVHDGQLTRSQLLDPWGGTLQFYKSGGEVLPFLTVTKGYELRSPGPDGKLGTSDDVKDPFERVLKSGTPYAEAVEEDRLVDARYDMRVADATVDAWSTMLREMTGTELGGLGLSGVGEGGGGSAGGLGLGTVGTVGHGAGRATFGSSRGIAYFSPPKRTDAQGRVTFEVPLGAVETTWQIALVGLPDAARPAVATVDVPVTLPLSAKVFAGDSFVEGDVVDAAITLRNRTDVPIDAAVEISTEGALSLAADARTQKVTIDRRGAKTIRVRTKAKQAGTGRLVVTTRAPGLPDDVLSHELEVKPAGEPVRLAHVTWVARSEDLSAWLDRSGLVATGDARLTFESGEDTTIDAALRSLDPDAMVSTESLADAIDMAALARGFAIERRGDADPLAVSTAKIEAFARGKLAAIRGKKGDADWVTAARAGRVSSTPSATACPGTGDGSEPLWTLANGLDAEPPAEGGSVKACWTTFVADALNRLDTSDDVASVARAALALARRPHRAEDAADVGKHLRKLVKLAPSGTIELAMPTTATRTLVYAALLATTPESDPGTRGKLLRWLLVQRDASGGFGSTAATRAVVQVLTSPAFVARTPVDTGIVVETRATDDGEAATRVVTVPARGRFAIDVPRGTKHLVVRPRDAGASIGVLARLERTYLRPFSVAPETMGAPVTLTVKWPAAKRGDVANLRVSVAETSHVWSSVEVKVPLPPGVVLADSVSGVRQVQGALYLRTTPKDLGDTVLVPLRFTLSGQVTVPEATAALVEVQAPLAYDRARPLTIEP